jgi:hypothetical protein
VADNYFLINWYIFIHTAYYSYSLLAFLQKNY